MSQIITPSATSLSKWHPTFTPSTVITVKENGMLIVMEFIVPSTSTFKMLEFSLTLEEAGLKV